MNPPLHEVEQIAIVGTGLLGASVAMGLKARGYRGRIVGVGRRQNTLDAAMATGGFDQITTDYADAIHRGGIQLAVICVPLGGFEAVFQALAAHDHRGLTITDAGSAKGVVLALAERDLPDPTRFVGAHPMAGSERQGPEAGDANLFQAKPCVICAAPGARPEVMGRVEGLWSTLGMSLLRMSAEEHDRHVATISHLPHLAAALLVAVADQRGGWALASTGFGDTTRVAGGSPTLWRDILAANRPAVLDALDAYRDQLDAVTQALRAGDDAAVLDMFENAKARRERWSPSRSAS